MAILKNKQTQQVVAGGIRDLQHANEMTERLGISLEELELIYTAEEIAQNRKTGYQKISDSLAIDYLAALTEYGESHDKAQLAKASWLNERNRIKALYPK